jgi:hypothetical protein
MIRLVSNRKCVNGVRNPFTIELIPLTYSEMESLTYHLGNISIQNRIDGYPRKFFKGGKWAKMMLSRYCLVLYDDEFTKISGCLIISTNSGKLTRCMYYEVEHKGLGVTDQVVTGDNISILPTYMNLDDLFNQ